jgi:AcrR family transcriptional regulator
MSRKVGRPSKKTETREKLVIHARELFVNTPYEKVSTRKIAESAGVNIAMIRYYFGSKQGLFEAMLRETVKPIEMQMRDFVLKSDQQNLIGLMRSYYQTMVDTPDFPKLVAQIMAMSESEMQRKMLEKIFSDISNPVQKMMFARMKQEGALRDGVDPELCRVTFFSMMVFPFIAPRAMYAIHGIELNRPFLDRLLEHNINVLTYGFLNPEPQSSLGDNNEI